MKDVSSSVRGLRANERAFEIDGAPDAGGRPRPVTVAVKVERGAPYEGFLPVKVQARHVEADGRTRALNGVPVEIPAKVLTLSLSALAEGTLSVETAVAEATTEALDRARKHHVALEAWFKLPADA